MKYILTVVIVLVSLVLGAVAFAYSGIYDVGADAKHTELVHTYLRIVRERSIETRIDELKVPADLSDPARIRQGSGNYAAMCVGCHLAPGMDETELSRGLYPSPPDLTRDAVGAAEAFWVIKHGIKASGMAAWGKSMDDEYIWNMAAFLQVLPELDEAEYRAIVASSGGHSHGGGETGGHSHGEGPAGGQSQDGAEGADHHAEDGSDGSHPHPPGTPEDHHAGASAEQSGQPEMVTHTHADGTVESHPVEPAAADGGDDTAEPDPAPEHDDGHQHQH